MEIKRFDTAWKNMIEAFFFPFLDFYFPTLSREIDHGKPARNLDKELRKLVPALALVKILSDLTAASLGLRFTL